MKQFIENIPEDQEILSAEIPDIDLYMDQITTLFEHKMQSNKRSAQEKLLTKSMINNYSKEGVLKSIKGKKYSKAHIIMMILIYNLKKTLSIADIKKLFTATDKEFSLDKATYHKEKLEALYTRYLQNKTIESGQMQSFLEGSAKELDLSPENKEDMLLMALYFSSASAYLKKYAEGIIDHYCEN